MPNPTKRKIGILASKQDKPKKFFHSAIIGKYLRSFEVEVVIEQKYDEDKIIFIYLTLSPAAVK